MITRVVLSLEKYANRMSYPTNTEGRCGRDHMVVGFTSTCAIVIINIIPSIKCPRGFNLEKKYPEGYFHGFKWIKRIRKKHPSHQYFILSDG